MLARRAVAQDAVGRQRRRERGRFAVEPWMSDHVDLCMHAVHPAVLDEAVDHPSRHARVEQLRARDQPPLPRGDQSGAPNSTSSPHTGD